MQLLDLKANNLVNRLIKGISANVLGQLLNIVSKLAIVPIFILSWGTERYGEWLLISSVISYLSLTDMGATNFITNKLTQAYAKSDSFVFNKVLVTGIRIFILIPLIILISIILITAAVPLKDLLSIKTISYFDLNIILLLLGLQVAISLTVGLILGVYRAIGFYARGTMISNFNILLQLILVITSLLTGLGLIGVVISQIVPIILVGIFAVFDLKNKLSSSGFRFRFLKIVQFEKNDLKYGLSFLFPSINFFIIQMSQLILIQGPVLVIGILLGAKEIVVFTTTRTVVNLIRQILGIIMNSAKPELTKFDAINDDNKLSLLFSKITQFTVYIGVSIGFLFHLFGENIYNFWLSDVPYNELLFDLFMINTIVLVFWFSFADFLMSINKHKQLSLVLIISSCLNILLCYSGTLLLDSFGSVLGLIIGDLIFCLVGSPFSDKV